MSKVSFLNLPRVAYEVFRKDRRAIAVQRHRPQSCRSTVAPDDARGALGAVGDTRAGLDGERGRGIVEHLRKTGKLVLKGGPSRQPPGAVFRKPITEQTWSR